MTGLLIAAASIATADKSALPAGLDFPPPFPTGPAGPVTPEPAKVRKPENVPAIGEAEGRVAELQKEVARALQAERDAPADKKAAIAAGRAETEAKLRFWQEQRDNMLSALANPPDPATVKRLEAESMATRIASAQKDLGAAKAYQEWVRATGIRAGDGYILTEARETSGELTKLGFRLGGAFWYGDSDGAGWSLIVSAGVSTTDPSQGMFIVWNVEQKRFTASSKSPKRSGKLTIVGGNGSILEAVGEDGTRFRFDVTAPEFIE